MREKINLFIFRRDLRLEDNHALFAALSDILPVLPVFIFDRNILDKLLKPYDKRVQFIYEQIEKMNNYLFEKYHSGIETYYDTPDGAIEHIIQKYDVNAVYINADYEPYAIHRDEQLQTLLHQKGIALYKFKDHVYFEPWEILNNQQKPFHVYTHYAKAWKQKFHQMHFETYPSEKFLYHLKKVSEKCSIIPYETLGFKKEKNIHYRPLNIHPHILLHYHETRNNIYEFQGTTNAGLYLRFGTVSTRFLIDKARQYSEAYLNELIWREFFQHLIYHYPYTIHQSFQTKYEHLNWENNTNLFEKWKSGQTGFPIIDAAMNELNATGYMHNRCRMIVANFLTKILLIDWRWGERYFAEKLLDFELASNVGNWQWSAGTGVDAAPYFRIFNPQLQQEKFDPEYTYIKQWIPEFNSSKYLPPIINYEERRKKALEVYKSSK